MEHTGPSNLDEVLEVERTHWYWLGDGEERSLPAMPRAHVLEVQLGCVLDPLDPE